MVKIEGTLDEIRELIGDVKRTVRSVKSTSKKVAKTASKTKRKFQLGSDTSKTSPTILNLNLETKKED